MALFMVGLYWHCLLPRLLALRLFKVFWLPILWVQHGKFDSGRGAVLRFRSIRACQILPGSASCHEEYAGDPAWMECKVVRAFYSSVATTVRLIVDGCRPFLSLSTSAIGLISKLVRASLCPWTFNMAFTLNVTHMSRSSCIKEQARFR
jgi:hypothetical protein